MLNPFAQDFTPVFTAEPTQKKEAPQPLTKQKNSQHKKKPQHNATDKPKTKPPSKKAEASTLLPPPAAGAVNKNKKKDSKKVPTSSQQQQQQRQRRDSKPNRGNKAAQPTAPSVDIFAKETKFITIEAAIDPIRRIEDPAYTVNSANSRRQSSGGGGSSTGANGGSRYRLEHGYERYIDWIDRSLKAFDTVTLIGMGNAVVDVVSLATVLQDRKIGVHDEIETFGMNAGNDRITSGIQLKLHSYY